MAKSGKVVERGKVSEFKWEAVNPLQSLKVRRDSGLRLC